MQLLSELVKVWLKDFYYQVVNIVLAKMVHSMPQVVRVHVVLVKPKFFSLLVKDPSAGQVLFNILTKDQMSEDQLVFCYGSSIQNQC